MAWTKLYRIVNTYPNTQYTSVKVTLNCLENIVAWTADQGWTLTNVGSTVINMVYCTTLTFSAGTPISYNGALQLGWQTADGSCRLRSMQWIAPPPPQVVASATQQQGVPGGGVAWGNYPLQGQFAFVVTNDTEGGLSLDHMQYAFHSPFTLDQLSHGAADGLAWKPLLSLSVPANFLVLAQGLSAQDAVPKGAANLPAGKHAKFFVAQWVSQFVPDDSGVTPAGALLLREAPWESGGPPSFCWIEQVVAPSVTIDTAAPFIPAATIAVADPQPPGLPDGMRLMKIEATVVNSSYAVWYVEGVSWTPQSGAAFPWWLDPDDAQKLYLLQESGRTYSVSLRAIDEAGNLSAPSKLSFTFA